MPLDIRRDMWFMHVGDLPHFSFIARPKLNNVFGYRIDGQMVGDGQKSPPP